MKKKETGFTLIELLVVMAILGLLATVGLVSFRTAQLKSRDARRKSDLAQIQKALEMYYNDRGGYPVADNGQIMGCGMAPESPTSCTWGVPWELAPPGEKTLYMKTLPEDSKQTYCYDSADGTDYKLYARLENVKDIDCLEDDCPLSATCAGNGYNYGVASSNVNP